jgi:hypothetical protein
VGLARDDRGESAVVADEAKAEQGAALDDDLNREWAGGACRRQRMLRRAELAQLAAPRPARAVPISLPSRAR